MMVSKHRLPILPILGLLVLACPGAQAGEEGPADRAAALDVALMADDVITAWTLAEGLVDAPEPWSGRGLAALTWLSRDLSRCSDHGRLPRVTRLLARGDADPWSRWQAWDLLRKNLERCRNWEGMDQAVAMTRTLTDWRVHAAPSATGLQDAFFRVRNWTPTRETAKGHLRWALRTSGRLFAATELCLEARTRLAVRLDSRAPGTLWIDGRLVLMAEPGTALLRSGPRAAGALTLDAGCHPVILGLATHPGWGRAAVRLLTVPHGEPASLAIPETAGARIAAAHGALLRGAPHEAADAMEDLIPGTPGLLLLRYRLESLLARNAPLEALVARGVRPARPGQESGQPPCLLWRQRLDEVLAAGIDEARPWLEFWAPACRKTLPGRLLEARHEADDGRSDEAATHAAEVEATLEKAGFASCLATTTRIAQRAGLGEAAPVLLDTDVFCSRAAFSDAAARGTADDAIRALALRDRLMAQDESFPGALQLARRLDATGMGTAARRLLEGLGWFDPDLTWARTDMGGGSADSLAATAASPMATMDLRAREGMLLSWKKLDRWAIPLDEVLDAYRGSDWGSGSLVLVLDETILRVRPQGRITERSTRVYHLRTPQAAQDWTDFQVPDAGQVIGLRVRKRDGTWREPDALGAGDLANLGELEEGDVVVIETVDEVDPVFSLADEFCLPTFHVAFRGTSVWRSRFVVHNETDRPLIATRFWGAPAASILDPRTRVFETRRIETTPDEEALHRWDAGLPRVEFCTEGLTWPRLRDHMADGLLARITPDPALRRLARELAERPDPLRACFDMVTRDIAPENATLFYKSAPDILADREGAGAVLLLALLVEMDIPATLVLMDPPGGPAALPGRGDPEVHREPLVRVQGPEGTIWLDPFGPAARFGELRPFLGGRPGLLLDTGSPHLRIRTPIVDPAAHAVHVRWDGAVLPDGGARARLTIRFSGIAGSSLRERLRQAPEERRREAVASFAQGFFAGAQVTSQAMDAGGDSLVFKVETTLAPGTFDEPTLLNLGSGTLQRRYASQSRRRLPILLGGNALTTVEVRLSAPPGRRFAVEGRQGRIETDFGVHETRWGSRRFLVIRHESHLSDSVLPASRYDELVRFTRTADALDRVVLTLTTRP